MSGAFLLDTNVLVALAWPTHSSHRSCVQWFERHAVEGWATCPLTQSATVRILSNPAFAPNALSPAGALELVRKNLNHPGHRFWKADISLFDALKPLSDRVTGHKQVADAYLLGLALHNKGALVTLDRGILAFLPERGADRGRVLVL